MPYHHFTAEERDELQVLLGFGAEVWFAARITGKHLSSVYRELSRNANSGFYLSYHADNTARTRRREASRRPKRGDARLLAEVERRIRLDHSPEQIAGRLKREHPKDPSWHVSHETIYQHVYAQSRKGSDLGNHLRQGHKKRRKRLSGKDRRGLIPNRTFIDQRPSVVDKKTRVGDWEGDTIEGGGKKGYIGTFVDRKTKYLVAFPLMRKTADSLVAKAGKAFARFPRRVRKTITVDNGKEFARHKELAVITGARVYFAHPYHSWERGLNEHTNGLLRQYLPKKLPLDSLDPRCLAKNVAKINNRPRKSLGYRTPREVFLKYLFALRT